MKNTDSKKEVGKGAKALKKGNSPKVNNKVMFHTTPVKPLRQKQQDQAKLSTPGSSNSKAKQDLTSVLKKLQGSTSSSSGKTNSKDVICEKIFYAKSLGARNGVDFIIGFNGLCKALEQHSTENPSLSIVAVAADGRVNLIQMLYQYANVKVAPIVLLPKCSAGLASAFNIKRAFCFALRITKDDATAESIGFDQRDAGMDQLREYLLSLKKD